MIFFKTLILILYCHLHLFSQATKSIETLSYGHSIWALQSVEGCRNWIKQVDNWYNLSYWYSIGFCSILSALSLLEPSRMDTLYGLYNLLKAAETELRKLKLCKPETQFVYYTLLSSRWKKYFIQKRIISDKYCVFRL